MADSWISHVVVTKTYETGARDAGVVIPVC